MFKKVMSLAVVLAVMLGCMGQAMALKMTEKPADGETMEQPFAAGTGGSDNFRIPGIVTLDDGTLIAACDARWNHAGDGAGLDTIVSVSKDGGKTWTYTFANYLGDNGDVYNQLSTCFIDPGIGTDGTTAYLIADLWPAGIALNTSKYKPVAGKSGFDENGNLLLRDSAKDYVKIGSSGYQNAAANAKYNVYLDLESLALFTYDAEGVAVRIEGYSVDAWFNIRSDDGSVNTNLFCADSPYQPYPTDYLYMTQSTDGLNWSAPQLLNLKEAEEQTLLVGPGNGTYDEVNDRMIFTAYEHTDEYERSCLIWMDAEGKWTRTEDATINSWSSEATSVVLADGTVRVFYRDGYTDLRYTDYVWDEAEQNYIRVRGATEVVTQAQVDAGCQLTSILYSQKVEGKDLILVAGPTSNRRINGYIYGFLVAEDGQMELAYAFNVTPDFYAYSCLTELKNGDIGLLYESAGSSITFQSFALDTVVSIKNDVRIETVPVTLMPGESVTVETKGAFTEENLAVMDTEVVKAEISGEQQLTFTAVYPGETELLIENQRFVITVPGEREKLVLCQGQSIVRENAESEGKDLFDSGIVSLSSQEGHLAHVLSGGDVAIADCLYTFQENADGSWYIWSTTSDGAKVYLNHAGTGNPNQPNALTASAITITRVSSRGYFRLTGKGNPDRTLHFHAELEEPYWNRCGSDNSTRCQQFLYRPAEAGEESSKEIPGYVRVLDKKEVVDGGQYLIATQNNARMYYLLHPSTGKAADHVARVRTGYSLTFTGEKVGQTVMQVGQIYYDITVTEHGEREVIRRNEVAATETTDGSYEEVEVCKDCGLELSSKTVILPATGGNKPTEPTQPPTQPETEPTTTPEKPTESSAPAATQGATEQPDAENGNSATIVVICAVCAVAIVIVALMLKRKKK